MAQITSGAVVLLGGVDLSCYLKSVKIDGKADMLESTALCDTVKKYVKGQNERKVSGEGFFNFTANTVDNIDGAFRTALADVTSDYLISVGPVDGSAGSPAIFGNVGMAKYEVNTITGELIMTTFEAQVTKTSTAEKLVTGFWMMKQVVTAATNGTTYDNAASGTGYLVNYHNLDGDNTCAFKLQHSTNGSAWADVTGSSATLAANAATQKQDSSTTINRYRRVVATPTGTTNTVGVAMAQSYAG